MRRFPLLLLPLTLAACAGYAIDYTRPKTSILGPQLERYDFGAAGAECVGDRLSQRLSVWQMRQLEMAAAARETGWYEPGRLSHRDLVHIANHLEDRRIGPVVAEAAGICGLAAAGEVAQLVPPPEPEPAAPAAGRAAAAEAMWISLGAAPSGQSIAVDATSVGEETPYRTGWFRLTDPGRAAPNPAAYLLRIDCAARTINPMRLRRYGAGDAVTEERDYGPEGEGALPVEPGTVMEIAFLSLCS